MYIVWPHEKKKHHSICQYIIIIIAGIIIIIYTYCYGDWEEMCTAIELNPHKYWENVPTIINILADRVPAFLVSNANHQ